MNIFNTLNISAERSKFWERMLLSAVMLNVGPLPDNWGGCGWVVGWGCWAAKAESKLEKDRKREICRGTCTHTHTQTHKYKLRGS